jgi:hypothetical protein
MIIIARYCPLAIPTPGAMLDARKPGFIYPDLMINGDWLLPY